MQSAEAMSNDKALPLYDAGSSEKPVTQFMRNNFQQIQRYMFCFWDVRYGYKFGLTEHGDWVGLKYWDYMDYKP